MGNCGGALSSPPTLSQAPAMTGRNMCPYWLTVGQVFRPVSGKWEILMARVEKNNYPKLGNHYQRNSEWFWEVKKHMSTTFQIFYAFLCICVFFLISLPSPLLPLHTPHARTHSHTCTHSVIITPRVLFFSANTK